MELSEMQQQVIELSKIEMLRKITLLEEQKRALSHEWLQTIKSLADQWDAFGTLKHGVSRGDIVESDGVRYVALAFIKPRIDCLPDYVWLGATLESDTRAESDKEVYKLTNWQKAEETA